jgi:hypothetical protein
VGDGARCALIQGHNLLSQPHGEGEEIEGVLAYHVFPWWGSKEAHSGSIELILAMNEKSRRSFGGENGHGVD